MTTKHSAYEIYEEALRDRASDDPLKKRQACEKGWLAVTEAVDEYLASRGKFVKKGTAEAHGKRNKFLAELAEIDPEMERLGRMVSTIADQLHGTCFYMGEDAPHFDNVLKKTVREILEITGHGNGELEG